MVEFGRSETWLSNCTNSTNPSYNHDARCLAIFYGKIVAASLSLAGCCLVLFMVLLYKKYRYFTNRMIMYLLLPSIVLSIIYIYPHQLDGTSVYCQMTGYLINACTFAQRSLILCIVIHLLMFSIKNRRPKYLEHVFLVVVCSSSLLISILPFIGKKSHYGYAGVWCWIKSESRYENMLRLFCMYFWLLLFIIVEFVCFVIVIIKVRKHLHQLQAAGINSSLAQVKIKQYKKQVYPLLCYPLVNMILAIPVTSNRLQNWIDPDDPVFGLYMAHCTIYPIWGFCNAMMYFVNKETIRELHPSSVWERITSWRRSSRTSQEQLLSAPQPSGSAVEEDYVVEGRTTASRDALHSATMDSSDME